MHMQELALHHALGTRTRSRGGVEIDNFPPGRNLRQRVKNLLSYIMDKKSKKRFVAYKDVVRSHFGKIPVALELPNDTRISGSFRMFECCIKSRTYIMSYLTNVETEEKIAELCLTKDDWQFLAEMESVMRNTNILALTMQVDNPGYSSFAYYEISKVKFHLRTLSQVDCYDISKVFQDLSYIPKTEIKRVDLMWDTKVFLNRLYDELNNYFPEPDFDQYLQMFFHPLMIRGGLTYLSFFEPNLFGSSKLDELKASTLEFVFDMFVEGLDMDDTCYGLEETKEEETNGMIDVEAYEMDHTTKTIYAAMLAKAKDPTTTETEEDVKRKRIENKKRELRRSIEMELDQYVTLCSKLDIRSSIEMYSSNLFNKKVVMERTEWDLLEKTVDAGFAYKYFDLLLWWKEKKESFFYLSVASAIILGKPVHNGYQERVFSRGVYVDTKLRQRLKDNNFEISILNNFNTTELERVMKVMEVQNSFSNAKLELVDNSLKSFFKEHPERIVYDIDDVMTTSSVSSDDEVSVNVEEIDKEIEDFMKNMEYDEEDNSEEEGTVVSTDDGNTTLTSE
jgi:hAT family C-terminal dimerisation region